MGHGRFPALADGSFQVFGQLQHLDQVGKLFHLADILTFAELEVRVKTVDMLQKDGMIDRLEERLKRAAKEVDARGETEIG